MEAFDFILALYSIIAGLGVSMLVKGVARMIEARDRLHLYWIHTGWVIVLYGTHVSSWFCAMAGPGARSMVGFGSRACRVQPRP
jgi:hypothetical protein